jgi:23S rRNA (adenine2503-C2)-methyltransferase
MKTKRFKHFANGSVYCLELEDGMLIETTDTFLPFYTKNAIGRHQNLLDNKELGNRSERYMIGVSVMSGCPVRCKFCATGQMKKWRNLTAQEIVDQVEFVVNKNPDVNPKNSKEFKINYTRCGEPFLNIEAVKDAINAISAKYPNTHHYISTIGIEDADYSWIKGNITLQISLHSLDEAHRNWLIPFNKKVSVSELGKIRTMSNLKTTLNLTLVDEKDFNIEKIKTYFDKDNFFIKLSPINPNVTSEKNDLGNGIIEGVNLI